MNTYGAVETTDKTLFMQCNDEETYTISIDDIEKLMIYHDRSNGNVPHTPESTNMIIASLLKKDYALKRIFSRNCVNAHISGDIHIHDLDMPDRSYCSGHSPAYIAKYGLSLPNLNSIAKPPKHADVFLEQIIKFAASMQGHFSGAIGFDAVNMFVAPYLRGLDDAKIKQLAQILVFEFAQQAVARGGQTIFSDLNLYWEIPKHYRDVPAIGPGGKETGMNYGEYDEESKRFFRALMNVYLEGDASGRPFFFPKPDCHITEESVMDDEYMNIIGEVASLRGSPYFVFDRGTDPSISQCCFDEATRVLVKDDAGVRLMNIKDVRINANIKVFHNGSWVKFKRVETSRSGKKMFKLRTTHGKELIATEDHLFPTLKGDLRADNLSTDDYVLFNARTLQNEPYYEQGMTYEQGVLIGAFLGDGSFNGDGFMLSLDEKSFEELEPLVRKGYKDFTGEERIPSHYIDGKLHTLYLGMHGINEYIKMWIRGYYAYDKSPNLDCIKESVDFRMGIIAGWEMTDGGNAHRIYSISKDMVEGFEAILTSLGIQCRIDLNDRTDEPMIIRGEIFKRNFPIYCLRMYDTKVHRNKEWIFKVRNNSVWFKIESIEELVDYDNEKVYCFEVENQDEPYFTMPSGWIVHNCRLKLALSKDDVNEMKIPWKSRFSALQNVSMNLPSFAYQAKDESAFYEILNKNMHLAGQAHMDKFAFFDRLMEMGSEGPLALLSMNHDGDPYVRYDKMKFLIGIVGLNEAVQILCGQQMHESKDALMLGMKMIAKMNKDCAEVAKDIGFTCILEQTPAESTAYRFARLDYKRFGEGLRPFLRGSMESGGIYYTNSTYINIGAPLSPVERVKTEGKFHPMIDAGSLTHVWLGETRPDASSIATFVRKTFQTTQNAQIAFSPEFTTCMSCNKTSRGLNDNCPYCASNRVEWATRITGFFSNIRGWNLGKREELKDRHRVSL